MPLRTKVRGLVSGGPSSDCSLVSRVDLFLAIARDHLESYRQNERKIKAPGLNLP